MGQISPRVFENAALGTPMALYEGTYSSVIRPYEHYFPIKKDKSNVDDFFDFLDRTEDLQAMADRAFADLIESKKYDYQSFSLLVYQEIKKIKDGEHKNRSVNKAQTTHLIQR